jgi:hypothetical protein
LLTNGDDPSKSSKVTIPVMVVAVEVVEDGTKSVVAVEGAGPGRGAIRVKGRFPLIRLVDCVDRPPELPTLCCKIVGS